MQLWDKDTVRFKYKTEFIWGSYGSLDYLGSIFQELERFFGIQNAAQSSFLILSTEQIWIVGDYIVFWAHRRAERTGCADMDLVTVIHWAGKRGLRLDQTNAWLESITSGLTKPTVLVLHVGTNDIEGCSKRAMANAVNRLITSNTETTIIWSDILERVEYKCCSPEEQEKLDDRRRATNRYARALAGRNGGKAIPHPDIRHKDRALYRPDGLHLSNEGLDRFITDLKEGLSYLGSSK